MKLKIALIAAVSLFVLLIAGLVVLRLSLESIVKVGIETIGPKVTGSKVAVGSLSFKLLKGELGIKGFELGNPKDFSTPYAIKASSVFIKLRPSTLLSSKIVVDQIDIDGVALNFEQGFPSSNLTTIKGNVDIFIKSLPGQGSGKATQEQTNADASSLSGKKLEVDSVSISNITVAFAIKGLSKEGAGTVVPGIKLSKLGEGPEGISPADLAARILDSLLTGALDSVRSALPGLKDLGDSLGKGASETLDSSKKGAEKVVDGAKGALDSVLGVFK